MTNVIGFVGVECYDLILYTAKTLVGLGDSVLVSDCSDTRALFKCFPIIEDWGGEITSFEGIDFVLDIESITEEYNWVLVDFGKRIKEFDDAWDCISFVTDYQSHNVDWILQCRVPEGVKTKVVLRDRISSKITPKAIVAQLSGLVSDEDEVVLLDDTQEDLEAKMLCQYNDRLRFTKVSQGIREFIAELLQGVWDRKPVMYAIKNVSRGK